MVNKSILSFLIVLLISVVNTSKINGCTNVLVTKGASKDGSVLISYSADSHILFGELYYKRGQNFAPGAMLKIYEWDTGKYLGEIKQVPKTYSTVGNMNEHQVIIGETTYGGLSQLEDTTGIMDYGSLIYIALQRSKSAREAIKIMSNLVNEYGYYSSGESFSIADKNEVWIMEMIGKGTKIVNGKNINKGAVWVAMRIPDGYVSAHANHARITQFPKNDPEYCLYSPDVITFARESGLYNGTDEEFSFSDIYAPLDFGSMRGCEARVWSAFNIMGKGLIGEFPYEKYLDYAKGHNPANRMPLYVKPAEKVGVKEIANIMRDHYEGTELDMTKDAGAGGYELPYRWRPMTFSIDGNSYTNERAIATQQTGFWFVAQSRSWLPDEIGGIIWFGVDDASTSVLTPIYTSSLEVPICFAEGNGHMTQYSSTSAFWLFNRISNFAYLYYNRVQPIVRKNIDQFENESLELVAKNDKLALNELKKSSEHAKLAVSKFSLERASQMFSKFKNLEEYLLVKFIDGNIKKDDSNGKFLDNGNGKNIPPSPLQPGYSDSWKREVVNTSGDRLKVVK